MPCAELQRYATRDPEDDQPPSLLQAPEQEGDGRDQGRTCVILDKETGEALQRFMHIRCGGNVGCGGATAAAISGTAVSAANK